MNTSLKTFTNRLRRTPRDFSTQRDRVIARRLYTAFERDLALVDLEGLHFYAYKGTVTIYGSVRHELDRDLLISIVRQIPGVKHVCTNLQIREHHDPDQAPT